MATDAPITGARTRASSIPSMSRRGMLGAVALTPLIAAPFIATVEARGASADRLFAEIEEHDARTLAFPETADDAALEKLVDDGLAIYLRVAALPNTPANLRVRARAIASITNMSADAANLDIDELWAHADGVGGDLLKQVMVCLLARKG